MGYGRQDQLTKARLCAAFGGNAGLSAAAATRLVGGADRQGKRAAVHSAPSGTGAPGRPVSALEETQADGRAELGDALQLLSETIRRRSLIVVLSDLLPPPPLSEVNRLQRIPTAAFGPVAGLVSLRAQKHDVIVLQILDADELELPWST